MATKATVGTAAGESVKPVLKTVEEWAREKGVSEAYLAGVKYLNKWGKGKAVSEKEFDSALRGFLSSPADGRKK